MKNMGMSLRHRQTANILILLAVMMLSGCAGLRLESPSVTLVSMNVIDVSLFEQRFAFKLRVQNPNDMDIPITGLSFEVRLNDQPFARGVSNKEVALPRMSEALMEVTAVSDLSSVMRQINELRKGNLNSVSYIIKGRLVTRSFPDLTFENRGMIDMPMPAK